MSAGKSVRLFLVDGSPGGMITAEIMNWTGHVISASRSELHALLKRPETARTGIYILLGDNPENSLLPLAYIGEGDQVKSRLYAHAKAADQNGKDFWERAIVLTSKDANLTKAHARYLESRLIVMATQAKRAKLRNGTSPDPISLPEADISDMEYFISQAEIVLPLLGVNILRSAKSATPSTPLPTTKPSDIKANPTFTMHLKKANIIARAQEIDGEFIILANSQARRGWSGREHGYRQLKKDLEARGILALSDNEETSVFTDNQAFSSPSSAAAIVAGRTANGRKEWKVEGSQITYHAWQESKLDEIDATIDTPEELG